MELLYYAIPFFLVTMGLEALLVRGRRVRGYAAPDSAASIGLGLGNLVIAGLAKLFVLALYVVVYERFRLFTLQTETSATVTSFVLLFVAEDLCYYAFHRSHHEVRLLWAGHVTHHSSTFYNLSTAVRQSWTTPITGFVFWLPLPLLGFHPKWILVQQSISLLYQYWIHTELIGRLGPFEWLFNTPSHHRVHHGRNPRYLDRNHGGILIVWDRLFGTFEPETEPVDYGITTPVPSHNPVVLAFHEWAAMLWDAWHAKTWRGRLGYLVRPPGWREDGTGKTADDLRRAALAA